ncbi:MAG: peptidoglycan-binding protein [Clostridia bacterium]|nr:peptidoglycan-binding protein [Clostridia bacterium]
MKRFLVWFLILALVIPTAAFADIPVVSFDDEPTSPPYTPPVVTPTTAPDPTSRPLPTYNPKTTGYIFPTSTPAPAVVTRTLRQGMTGSDVLLVQQKLQALGYYQGLLNSEFNESLAYAVRLFQTDWNSYNPDQPALAVDGVVGPSTRAVLFGSEAKVTAPPNTFTLEKGMKGEEVLTAQKRLAQLGYYLGELDGEYNDSMVYAVKQMQAKNEITVDGKIGYNTRMLMYSDSVIKADYPDYNIATLSIGMSGEDVKELQRQLRNTYYYSGTIDGIFGTAVQNAVKAFQASNGLSVDGKVGPRTFDALYNRNGIIFNGGIPSRELSKGSRGWDVKILQDKLINLNYTFDNWYEEGYFDDSTVSAVKRFQQKNGLKVTGIYDSTMRRYLWPTVVEIEEAIEQSFEGTPDDPYVGRTLKVGSYGEDVKAIQMKLLGSGYMTGNADGIYGALTKAAVKRFQRDYSALYGLKVDGIVGPKTWVAINTELSSWGAEQTHVTNNTTYVGGFNRTLRIGSHGNDVKKLQNALRDMGYYYGNIDGIYGTLTWAAVRQFQWDYKNYNSTTPITSVDGIAGPATFVVMQQVVDWTKY